MRAWGLRPSHGKAPSPPDFEIFKFVFIDERKVPTAGPKACRCCCAAGPHFTGIPAECGPRNISSIQPSAYGTPRCRLLYNSFSSKVKTSLKLYFIIYTLNYN